MAQTADPPKSSGLFSQKYFQTILRYLAMLLMAFLLFGIILLLSGKNPFLSFRDIFRSTFGSAYGFSEVLVAMTPILITAVAVAFPARVGLINVGAEGQLYMGALLATWGALSFSGGPAWALLPAMALLGMLGGSLWALLPGDLKIDRAGERDHYLLAPEFRGAFDRILFYLRLLACSKEYQHHFQFRPSGPPPDAAGHPDRS